MKLNKGWRLYYIDDVFASKMPLNKLKDSMEPFNDVELPTLLELELFKHNIIPDPYVSTNVWEIQKFESYHQYYVLSFKSASKHKFLRFHGVDTLSEIYVNGELIGKTDNMFMPFTFELNNLKKENELIVHILPAVVEGRKLTDNSKVHAMPFNFESLHIRKTPSSFGWDILPRTPLGGIYKEVELLNSLPIIEDVNVISSNVSNEKATLKFEVISSYEEKYDFIVEGKCQNNSFKLFNIYSSITLYYPLLWNIRGYGKQYRYTITVKALNSNGKVCAKKTFKYGIRNVELKRTSFVQENGCFEFHINGRKVFLLGSNWVPIEAIKHLDDERMLKTLDMLIDLGCNAIRVWGGGTYESELFYEKCDELGIFVWQDFMMGCAVYPQDLSFQKKIRKEAQYISQHLGKHCSICLWAGDNENDFAAAFWSKGRIVMPNGNVLTRKVLPDVLKRDKSRPYLPSSPYIDMEAEKHLDKPLSEDHLWGPRDYFKGEFYRNAKCYFTSETGYHALNNVESLYKFINKPWPLFINDPLIYDKNGDISYDNKPTKEYLCHAVSVVDDYNSTFAYRIVLMANQVNTLFTNKIDNLEDFVMASQISQAEAMKFFIEKMRKDYKRNGGIIWWNIMDGWPQVSDAVVDYYFGKKLAYNYIKRSQYSTFLMMNEDDDGLHLYAVSSENASHTLSYEIIDAYNNKVIDTGVIKTKKRDSFIYKQYDVKEKTLLIIRYKDEKGNEFINHFHTNIIDIDLYKYVSTMKEYKLI